MTIKVYSLAAEDLILPMEVTCKFRRQNEGNTRELGIQEGSRGLEQAFLLSVLVLS